MSEFEAENAPRQPQEDVEGAEHTETPVFYYRVELLTDRPNSTSAAIQEFESVTGTEIQDGREDDRSRVIFYKVEETPEAQSVVRMQAEMYFAALPALGVEVDSCELFTDESWKTRWKEFFKPTLVSPRVRVGPPWEDFEAPKNSHRLVINPAMAFGVGTHETTQLAATLVDEALAEASAPETDNPASVLDVGCGSGILSMIAARLGAAPVTGIDIDEEALESARENLESNDLDQQVNLSARPLEDLDGKFDMVVANIIAPTLLELRDGLVERVARGGRLILSGISAEQLDWFKGQFVPAGWRVLTEVTDGEWAGMVLESNANHD